MFGSDHICYLRTNDLLMASDAGNGSVFILLDLSVTFDNAYHNILPKSWLVSLALHWTGLPYVYLTGLFLLGRASSFLPLPL